MWTIALLNCLAFGGLLFLLSAGYSLIFGLMRIPNMAHGTAFLLGGYVGIALSDAGAPFTLAVVGAGATVGLLGLAIEQTVLRRLAGQESAEVLATIGVGLVGSNICLLIWGGDPVQFAAPAVLQGSVREFGMIFPTYRLFLTVLALVVAVALYLLIDRTKLGAMIRAAVDDREMARAVGIPVSRLFALVFASGSFLVGAAGALSVPVLSAYPGLDSTMLLFALMVVIIGGAGSLVGAMVGSLIVSTLYTLGPALVPNFSYGVLFLPMAAVLIVRPRGLFGRALT